MTETIFATLGVLVCVALLIHMALPPARRQRVNATAWRAWHACRRLGLRAWYGLLQLRHGRAARKDAAQVADEAIRRARGDVTRDGNVYKPKSFRRPRKPH
ncbi:MAG TPA: hypothetical protein VLA16_27825 [Ideonella sp.]|nr:hypothetical protein [Ideonella sp.]